ncbi:MAG: DUF4349 domain-containing protein [Proteobacteria bacterium]|nr:DUF4349 domain-containing protein [Pseudomonadota bacterium]
MNKKLFCMLSLTLILNACGKSSDGNRNLDSAAQNRAANGESYLAYEHSVTIDVTKEALKTTFNSAIEACVKDSQNQCTILYSEISSGDFATASIRMRLKSEGIDPILTISAKEGLITKRSTHVEDLAEPIIDSERQLAMVEGYLENLERLQDESKNNVEALIKVASEIAITQSKLDVLKGEHTYLKQRVNLDVLNLQIVIDQNSSFWLPILESFSGFSDNLSEGIAEAIIGFAYLLPWLFILVSLVFFFRFLWRRTLK